MEPLELEIQSDGKSRYPTSDSRPWPPGPRPGSWPPGRRPGPGMPARKDYLDETASPWGPGYDGWNGRGYDNGGATQPPREDAASVVARILLAAEHQAAGITELASYRAAIITRQVADEAAEIRDAAKREANQILRRANMHAAAVREAAEREAAEVRGAVSTLPNPVLPQTPPAERPQARPPATPATQPGTRPATPPTEGLATRPAARPPGRSRPRSDMKPVGRGRQAVGMRVAAITTSALLLVAVAAGATEICLHGFAFFVFRSVGTGETGRGPGGLSEDQGPGLPGAPKPAPSHSKAKPIRRTAVTVHTTVSSKISTN